MKSIQVQNNQLLWQDVADPTYGPDDVLVNIHTTALNRADLSQRAGHYPPPPGAPDIMGLEMAGEIAQLGANVTGWQVGDRVCALLAGGGYAEQVALPHQLLMPVPNGWSDVEAGSMPEVFLTCYVNLFMEANFQAGETVLVHGGGSGIGTAAIQLIRAAGGRIAVTAGSEAKLEQCRALGADLVINYREEDFVERVREFTDGKGVDIVLDMVGADYLERNVSLLKLKGRLVWIATLSGTQATVDIRALMGRRLRLIGSVLRSRSLDEKIEIKERFMAQFWSTLEAGDIKPIIDSVYPVAEAEAAQAHMESYGNVGKIVLQVK